jgi:3-hydroxyisobutyrate dehydrogenase
MKPRVGFVGVGRMGANMAHCLKDAGYQISAVYDVQTDVAKEVAEQVGATLALNLPSVTAASNVVITVISNDQAMRDIFATQGDTLLTGAKGVTFINCATLSPNVHCEVEQAVKSVGGHCLEAAMASSITQARNGTLYLMVGGDEEIFTAQREILDTLSKSLRYIGKMGDAAKVKALVNMVMNCNTAALAEGLGLADALGLDLSVLREVFSQTGANSRVLETDAEDMQSREHDCYFSSEHAAKDSGIANALAAEVGLDVPISKATEAQYKKMIELGLGSLDKSGIAELTFLGRGKNA